MIKQNAGKDNHHKDFVKQYDLNLNSLEKILISNLQFYAEYLGVLVGRVYDAQIEGDTFNLKESFLMSKNIRVVKDSVEDSINFNKLFKQNDFVFVKEYSQLILDLMKKHKNNLKNLISVSGTNNYSSIQLVTLPLLQSVNHMMSLQEDVSDLGNLYSEEDTDLLKEIFVKNDNSSYAPLKRDLFKKIKNLNLEKNNYSSKISSEILHSNDFNNVNMKVDDKIIMQNKEEERQREISKIRDIFSQEYRTKEREIMRILEKEDIYFSRGDYTKSYDTAAYYFANRSKKTHTNGENKSTSTYENHIRDLNLLLRYAELHKTKVFLKRVGKNPELKTKFIQC